MYQQQAEAPFLQNRSSRAERLPRFFIHVYRLVAQVPQGKVVTYGQVAALLGAPRAARAVGTALRYLPRPLSRKVPWQRVINAAGGISLRGDVFRAEEQRWLLEAEGILFDRRGYGIRISLPVDCRDSM